jgi:hypothetical protein
MSFLASSLFGRDFVNYRKNSAHYERTQFSSKVRMQGVGLIPIVIDSVDEEISLLLGGNNATTISRNRNYGKEYVIHMDTVIKDFIQTVESDICKLSPQFWEGKKLKLGLEDGTIITDLSMTLGVAYKKFKNTKDNILYILITQETTIYGYIMSILRYLGLVPKQSI